MPAHSVLDHLCTGWVPVLSLLLACGEVVSCSHTLLQNGVWPHETIMERVVGLSAISKICDFAVWMLHGSSDWVRMQSDFTVETNISHILQASSQLLPYLS